MCVCVCVCIFFQNVSIHNILFSPPYLYQFGDTQTHTHTYRLSARVFEDAMKTYTHTHTQPDTEEGINKMGVVKGDKGSSWRIGRVLETWVRECGMAGLVMALHVKGQVRMCVCVCVCMRIGCVVEIYIYGYVHVYIHTYTHTHTHAVGGDGAMS